MRSSPQVATNIVENSIAVDERKSPLAPLFQRGGLYRGFLARLRELFCVDYLKNKLILLLLPLLLSACATPHAPSAPQTIETNYAYLEHFTLMARVSIRVGEKLDTVKLDWTRAPPDEAIKIFTPFGAQVAEITATRDGATVKNASGTQSAATVGDITASALGVRLDTAMLARWVQGRDLNSAASFAVFPESGNAPAWKVEAENFRIIDGARVAGRVTAIAGDTVVKVVIDEFRAL
jgi:outer membrane biogenesis lipoprotein LolB